MNAPFSKAEIQELSQEIDRQLKELSSVTPSPDIGTVRSGDGELRASLDRQKQAIVQATGEDPENFLQRFARATRKDLCSEGGVLYTQWKNYADLDNKDTIRTFRSVLVAMGITGEYVPLLVVALAVIVLHLGVKTICEEYGQEMGE